MVEANRSQHIHKLLRDRDIHYDVLGIDSTIPYKYTRIKAQVQTRKAKSAPKPVLDWKDYYPLQNINTWMQNLEKAYPSTCTVITIGKSVEGRDINMLKISNSDASNTGVWLDGGIHAREWISVSVVTYIGNYLAATFSKQPDYVTNKDWHIVPVLNPDGYEYTFTGDRMWRKSRSRMGGTVVGVDLNRNFAGNWSAKKDSSQDDPNNKNYRGPEPFSEPETAAVKDLILYTGTKFKIFVTFHAYSEVVAFPWCVNDEPCEDYIKLLEGATIMAKAMYETTGRIYKAGNFRDIMYSAAGTSLDWSYGTAHIPFSYLIELRSKEYKFELPKDEIVDCSREALSAVLALANYVDEYEKGNNDSFYQIRRRKFQIHSPSVNS